MTVQLSSQTAAKLQHIAEVLKIKEGTLLERAVQYYIAALDKEMDLKEELNTWDALSDESLDNFEKTLN